MRRNFQQSVVGKMQREVEKLGRRASGSDIRRVVDRYSRKMQPGNLLRELLGKDAARMAVEVERYARGQGLSRRILGGVLSAIGPAGKLIRGLIEPEKVGRELLGREMQVATDFLRAFGRLVIEPGQQDQAEALAEHLRTQGYVVLPPSGKPQPAGTRTGRGDLPTGRPVSTPTPTAPTEKSKTANVQLGTTRRRFPADHPIVTGEMVLTPNSTNIYSVGYDVGSFYLYVRFLDSRDGKRSGPGALYRYAGVTPQEFLGLYRVRSGGGGQGGSSTPGTWLWTHLRIRGTLSGHKKDYELVGVIGNYVPRKATLVPEGEAFIRRTVRTLEGKTIRSVLDNRLVRPLTPVKVQGARRAK
jgi:hypothetical protein